MITGKKIEYSDGVGCCIWEVLTENEDTGLCFDFAYEDIDNIIKLLKQLKKIKAEKYKDEK